MAVYVYARDISSGEAKRKSEFEVILRDVVARHSDAGEKSFQAFIKMKKLSDTTPEDIGGGINLLDLGASGQPPEYWKPLAYLTNLIGFDPNAEECEQLKQQKTAFLSQTFLPYAIAGKTGEFTLFQTRSVYCWSLLKPDLEWLRRFTVFDLFEIEGTQQITATKLNDVTELQTIEIDAMKLDTQGLELPILSAAANMVDRCILIETETGLSENYHDETTFDQIMQFMLAQGYGLFAINTNHRVPRSNGFSGAATNEQILWCEAIWLRDFLRKPPQASLTREKAIKALCMYANHGCYSFGLETAGYFHRSGLIRDEEFEWMSKDLSFWKFPEARPSLRRRLLRFALDMVPRRYFGSIAANLNALDGSLHPINRIARK